MKMLNPLDYGLNNAKTGVERYRILMKCHQEALSQGCGISYAGIKEIDLEIPPSSQSIPLPDFIDFANTEIWVTNCQKTTFLFHKGGELEGLEISPEDIDKGDYTNYPILKKGHFLLVLEDLNPWSKRLHYDEVAIRKDILLIIIK